MAMVSGVRARLLSSVVGRSTLVGVGRDAVRAPSWAAVSDVRARRRWARSHTHSADLGEPTIRVTFITGDGSEQTVMGHEGQSLLAVAHRNGVDMEGACEASIACSTCHVILEDDVFDALEEPTEDEDDMLDQAPGLTMTSRLGCQVFLQPEFDGLRVQLPTATRNFYVDGHKPQPH